MTRSGRTLPWSLVACAAIACSGTHATPSEDEGEGEGEGKDAATAQDARAAVMADAEAILALSVQTCELTDRCFAALRTGFATNAFGLDGQDLRSERCAEVSERAFEQGPLPALLSSIEAGRVIYHPERLAACKRANAERGCNQLSNLLAACAAAFEGTVAIGERCATQYDCGPEAYCDLGLTAEASCPSRCKARVASGDACKLSAECPEGTRCYDPELVPGRPLASRCLPPPGEGESCHNLHCGDGLVCAVPAPEDRSCQPLVRARPGEPCSLTAQCEDGAACRAGDGGEPTCTSESEGASCSRDSQCTADQFCGCNDPSCTARVCLRWPEAGEECGAIAVGSKLACARGTSCEAGLCQPLGELGDSCADNRSCLSFQCASGKCIVPGDCG